MRNVLFGAADPMTAPAFHATLLPIVLSEVVEFARSLIPAVKGQESFHGYPHLQAYRLWHAICLAEMGDLVLAKRYVRILPATCSCSYIVDTLMPLTLRSVRRREHRLTIRLHSSSNSKTFRIGLWRHLMPTRPRPGYLSPLSAP